MKINKLFTVLFLLISISLLASCQSKLQSENGTKVENKYPQKTIRVINMLAANIPPDISIREIAGIMSNKYGWKFEFENDPSERGAAAINKVWKAPHDGYTVLAHTEVIVAPIVYGTTKYSTKDWKFFIAEHVDTVFCVRNDLGISNFQEFIKYAKSNEGKVRVGVSVEGNPFHLKAIALEKVAGIDLNIKAYPTSKGQIEDLKNAKLDAVLNPLQVTTPLIRQGIIKPIVMMDEQGYNYGEASQRIESIVKLYPEYKKYLPLDAVIAFALPKDVPQEVYDAFNSAFTEVMSTPEMLEVARKSDSSVLNLTGTEASEYMRKIEMNFYKLAKELGMAKVDPSTLIPSK